MAALPGAAADEFPLLGRPEATKRGAYRTLAGTSTQCFAEIGARVEAPPLKSPHGLPDKVAGRES